MHSDLEARHAIRTELDQSFFIEAAAGTGKTHELVGRAVALLASGHASVDRLAMITFTEKAAGELKLRLRAELDYARLNVSGVAQTRLESAISQLEEASIDTIHGFCRDILRTRPIEAGIDPQFEIEADGERWVKKVFRSWLAEQLANPPPGVARFLARGRATQPQTTPSTQLERAVSDLLTWRDLPKSWPKLDVDLEEAYSTIETRIRTFIEQLLGGDPQDPLRLSLAPFEHYASWQKQGPHALPEREAHLVQLSKLLAPILSSKRGGPKNSSRMGYGPFSNNINRSQLIAEAKSLNDALSELVRIADQDLAALLREELRDVEEQYVSSLRRSGRLDFQDLLILSRDLIRDNEEIRRKLQDRYQHILVDEFQDTDPLQIEIILLLSASDPTEDNFLKATPAPGKLTLVGDPKQSIYSFRRADLDLYSQIKTTLIQHGGVRFVTLRTSHRSVMPLQATINGCFETAFDQDPKSEGYVPLAGGPLPINDQPSTIALPVPKPIGDYGNVYNRKVEDEIPETVASFLDWLLHQSEWKVRDKDRTRIITASDVCLLFRSAQRFGRLLTQPFEVALSARGIDTILMGARTLNDRDEVETLLTALSAIEWPTDELSVYGTLRGSLFAFSDEDLYQCRKLYGPLHPYRQIPEDLDETNRAIFDALGILRKLSRRRNHRPFAETIQNLLQDTRAHIAFALRPNGASALNHIERTIDLARRFETQDGFSFRGLVTYLRQEANHARTHEGVSNETHSPGVRMMTVHKAKGLEFPVVVIADPTVKVRQVANRWIDSSAGLGVTRIAGLSPRSLEENQDRSFALEKSESVRLAYVACTRARDLLVIPSTGPVAPRLEQESWLAPVLKAIRPPAARERSPKPHSYRLPQFGSDSLVPIETQMPRNVCPGLHEGRYGQFEVTWWDPNILPPRPAPRFGLTHEEFLTSGPEAENAINAYQAWKTRRDDVRLIAGDPTVLVKDLRIKSAHRSKVPIALPRRIAPHIERPAGPRYVQVILRVIRDLDPKANLKHAFALLELHARRLSMKEQEKLIAAEVIEAYLRDDILERARNASLCHRNYPLIGLDDDGSVIDGALVLLFRESPEASAPWMGVDCIVDDAAEDPVKAKLEHLLELLISQGHNIGSGLILRL